jgi:GTPase SAR1 family protein
MRLIHQDDKLSVQNVDITQNAVSHFKHCKLLPNSIRAIIVGPSNCGKTNVIISLITHPNGLKFENVYVYSKSLEQPTYVYLSKILSDMKGIGYYTFSENNAILEPNEAKQNSIFVFDDVACEKQNHMRSYFCRGRHKDIDSFYLSQTYSHIPKQLIRDNANILVIFKQDNLNLKHIYDDHVNIDMELNKFHEICSLCWKEKYDFLVINKDCSIENGRYRKGFDVFILL